MILLVVYLALMITGNFIAYGAELVIEKRAVGEPAGLPVHVFHVAWPVLGDRGAAHAAEDGVEDRLNWRDSRRYRRGGRAAAARR